jgi:dTDP-4-dehydrorhamnose 3,5-epimerase
MRFEAIDLDGAWLVHPEKMQDSRGYFVRTFCINEFRDKGLATGFPQHSVSSSSKKGTVRGMHFQRDPHGEVKLVRCLSGAIWDVIIDIRPESPTFRQSRGFELSGENGLQLYIPTGFAHGFQTLQDDTRVNYLISEFHVSGAADGIRYNEPAFDVKWPQPVTTIAEKDLLWPDFEA